MDFIEIAPLSALLSHTRFQLTLRAADGAYHSLLLFRLAAAPVAPGSPDVGAQIAQMYAMEAACPHLGADMSHAEVEIEDDAVVGAVAVCPWHRYDFDLRTGQSETGLRACTYKVEGRRNSTNVGGDGEVCVWVEAPECGSGWQLVELRPVSEEFSDPPPLPDVSGLSIGSPGVAPHREEEEEDMVPADAPRTLIQWAVLILNTPNPQLKVERTRHAVHLFRTGKLASIGRGSGAPKPPDTPPREERLKFVDPGHTGNRRSKVAMLHALANIEQWAIDLAWDIIARFGPAHALLPPQFFADFTKVALDEAKHFSLLCARLRTLGVRYGAHAVHAALLQSAAATAGSLRARLALIHLVHEVRGLDVNPGTIARFRRQGDAESVRVLEIIHADEVTHVTAGHRWFTFVCAEAGVDPVAAFREEVRRHFVGALKGPFNEADRRKAGMTPEFYEGLRGEADYSARPSAAEVVVEYEKTVGKGVS